VVSDIYGSQSIMDIQIEQIGKDPFTFTNNFIPLRLHAETKESIMRVLSKIKPKNSAYYYGAILAEKTVVALIKNDSKITVIPAGKILINLNVI